MSMSMDDFDKIKQCPNCGKAIKVLKLNFIKKKLGNVSEDILQSFKYCSSCKRNMNKTMD